MVSVCPPGYIRLLYIKVQCNFIGAVPESSSGASLTSSAADIVSGSPLLDAVTFVPDTADQVLKGSGSSVTLSSNDMIELKFDVNILNKDIESLTFDVDGSGNLQIMLLDSAVESMIVVRQKCFTQ